MNLELTPSAVPATKSGMLPSYPIVRVGAQLGCDPSDVAGGNGAQHERRLKIQQARS